MPRIVLDRAVVEEITRDREWDHARLRQSDHRQVPVHSASPLHGDRIPGPAIAAANRCPACTHPGVAFRSPREVAADIAEMQVVHDQRLKLMYCEGAPLERCEFCGTLWRADETLWRSAISSYRRDHYGAALLAALHRADRELSWRDQCWLEAQGVAAGAQILEVGSYVCGFLAFAASRGADTTGVDPNPQMVSWGRRLGLDVRLGTIDQQNLPPRRFDSVWILNCFEQVPDPHLLLAEAHRLVRPRARLVLRTPNAAFLTLAYEHPDDRLRTMAQRHGLWGMPHLCCYSPAAVAGLLAAHGFIVETFRTSPHVDIAAETATGVPPAWFDVTARAI